MATYRDPRYPYVAGPRHSTTAVYDTSFDTRYGGSHRTIYDSRPMSSGRNYYSHAGPRSSIDPTSNGMSSYGSHGNRPRRNSSIGPTARSTLSLSDHNRPLIRPHDAPRSPLPKIYVPDADKVIHPATSRRHERHNSATTDDISRMSLLERDQVERSRNHRNSYIGRPKEYLTSRTMADDDYSYTGPREQFERDYPVRTRQPREKFAKGERPVSMIDYGEYKPAPAPRREPPPASAKHFERLEKADLLRTGSRSGSEDLVRRRESAKKPVSVHQYDRDEGYSSQREDYDRRLPRHDRSFDEERYMNDSQRHRRGAHHDHRSSKARHDRHESNDRSGVSSTLAGIGATGLAALGATSLKDSREDKHAREKDTDREDEARRREKEKRHQERELERRERHAERERARGKKDEGRRDSDDRNGEIAKEKSDSDSNREKLRRRHHRHENLQAAAAVAAGAAVMDTKDETPHERRHRHRHRRHKSRDPDARGRTIEYENEAGIVASPVDMRGDEQKPRKSVTVVEPAKGPPKEDIKPRSILKKPTVAFPEDTSASREGVALFKDDPKKDQIPEGAKWTKIKRVAVSPAACEASGERFEARDDYVIVLRPLTKAEVQKLATKTAEIRRARAEELQQQEQAPEDEESYSSDSSFTSSDGTYSSDGGPSPERHSRRSPPQQTEQERTLSIEPPPQQHVDPIAQITGQASQGLAPAVVQAHAAPPALPAQTQHQAAPYPPAPYQQAPYQQAPYPSQTGYSHPLPQHTVQQQPL